MTTKYLLPCACGKTTPIETSQAGETFSCACGEPLIAPTLRGIRQLPVADDAALAQGRPGKSLVAAWGPAHGILLLGVIFALAGVGTEAYLLATWPRIDPDRVKAQAGLLTPGQSWGAWLNLQQGIEHGNYSLESGSIVMSAKRRQTAAISGGIAIVFGVAMLSLGGYHLFTPPAPRKPPS